MDGETIEITMADGLGGEASSLVTSLAAREAEMVLCPSCEDMRMLIREDHPTGRCPVCRHVVRSALALGTESKEAWDSMDDEEKPDV